MKVLITHASAGAGHRRAAEAVYHYLKDQHPALDCEIIDILEKSNPLFKTSYTRGYSFLVNHGIALWAAAFWLTEVKWLRFLTRPIASFINKLNTAGFARFLIQAEFDWIISTHFLPSEIAASLKQKRKIRSKIITVITDYAVHPFWLTDGTDIYVAASAATKNRFILEGINQKDIKVLGIPVDTKFFKSHDKDSLRRKFDIDPGIFTVLLMTGSFGVGPFEEIIDILGRDVQFLAVCATNKKLYRRLQKKNFANVKVFGFVDNPEELMAASDIIITKPGGLSIAEILCMELPPIFIRAIPGQETENQKILKELGVGLNPGSVNEIKELILDLKDNPHKLAQIKDNIRRIKKPDSAQEICNVVCKGSTGDSR